MQRHRHGVARSVVHGATEAGRQHDHTRRAKCQCGRDPCVVGDGTVDDVPTVNANRRQQDREGSAAEDRLYSGTARQHHLAPVDDAGGDHGAGDRRILQSLHRQVARDHRSESGGIQQMRPAAEHRVEPAERSQRVDVAAFDTHPDPAQSLDTFRSRIAREEHTIDRPHRRTDDKVRLHARSDKRAKHPDLHRAVTSAAGEHEHGATGSH